MAVALLSPLVMIVATNPAIADKTLVLGGVQHAASLPGLIAGCEGVIDWPDNTPGENGWVDQPEAKFAWEINPPVYGNFSPRHWTGPSVLDLTAPSFISPAQGVDNEYHGGMMVWYAANTPDKTREALLAWAKAQKLPETIVAPWSGASWLWTRGRNIIITSWGKSQGCVDFNPDVILAFHKATFRNLRSNADRNGRDPKAEWISHSLMRA
jgi:hypothetical protein